MSGHNNMQGRQLAIEPGLLVGWVTASAIMPTAACTCHSVHMSGCHYCYHWQMVNNLISYNGDNRCITANGQIDDNSCGDDNKF